MTWKALLGIAVAGGIPPVIAIAAPAVEATSAGDLPPWAASSIFAALLVWVLVWIQTFFDSLLLRIDTNSLLVAYLQKEVLASLAYASELDFDEGSDPRIRALSDHYKRAAASSDKLIALIESRMKGNKE